MAGKPNMKTTGQQTTEPPGYVQPYLAGAANDAYSIFQSLGGSGVPSQPPPPMPADSSGGKNNGLNLGQSTGTAGANDNGKRNGTATGQTTGAPPTQPPVAPVIGGAGGATGTGSPGVSTQTTQGLDLLTQLAKSPIANLAGGNDFIASLLNGSGGVSTADEFAKLAQGDGINTGPAFSSIFNAAGQPTLSGTVGQSLAGGINPGQINTGPAYNAVYNAAGQPSQSAKAAAALGNGITGQVGTEGDYRGLLSQVQGPGAAESYLTDYANGSKLTGNPQLDALIADTNASVGNQVKDAFSGAGRYGSATMTDALTRALAANESNLRFADYNNQEQNQLGAANALEAAQQGRAGIAGGILGDISGVQSGNIATQLQNAGLKLGAAGQADQANQGLLGTQLNAAGGLTDAQQLGITNNFTNAGLKLSAAGQADTANQNARGQQLDAANSLTGAQAQHFNDLITALNGQTGVEGGNISAALSALGLVPGLDAAKYAGADNLLSAGQVAEGLPWLNLQNYEGVLGPLVNASGSTTTTSEPRKPVANTIGAIASLLGAFL